MEKNKEETKEPKVKADDFVEYEGYDEPMDYTNFQELEAKFNQLKEVVDEVVSILRANNLTRTENIEAPYYDEDSVYKELE